MEGPSQAELRRLNQEETKMVLTRWDPLFDLRRAHLLMDRRRPRFFELPTENWSDNLADHRDWVIPLDIVRSEDNVTVHATLQGVNPDDIDVTVDDAVLSIKAETEADEERKDGDYVARERRYGKVPSVDAPARERGCRPRRASLRERRADHQTSGGRVQESQTAQGDRRQRAD